MKKNAKLTALTLCLALLFCVGCGKEEEDTLDIDDIVIGGSAESDIEAENSGDAAQVIPYATDGSVSYSTTLYLLMMEEAFQNIQLSYDLEYTEVLDAAVKLDDGSVTTGAEYIRSNADTSFHWHYVVERLCREAGLEIEKSGYYTQALYYAKQSRATAGEFYDYFNISNADLLEYFMYQYRYNDLFFHTYGSGGSKEIPESELERLMTAGSYRIEYIYLPFTDAASGAALSQEDIAARREMIKDYESRYLNGEDFEELIYESYRFLSPDVTRTDSTDYNYYISRSGGSSYQDISDAAAALKDGESAGVETDSYCALVLRLPVNAVHSDKWRSAALQLAYTDKYGQEFNSYMVEQYNSIEPDYNQGVRSLLTPEAYVSLLKEYYGQ